MSLARARFGFGMILLGIVGWGACDTSALSADGRPCPCASGWVCCEDEAICVPEGSVCGPTGDVTPPSATVSTERTQVFAAVRDVRWSVLEGDAGGVIDSNGRYTAPSQVGTFHVVATPTDAAFPPIRTKVTVKPRDLSVLAGQPGGSGWRDGVGGSARFGQIQGMAGDGLGNVYIFDVGGGVRLRKLNVATGAVSTVSTYPPPAPAMDERDGLPGQATMQWGGENAVYKNGVLYFSEGYVVRRIDVSTGALETIAGRPSDNRSGVSDHLPVDGVGSLARFDSIRGLEVDESGHLWLGDTNLIRRVNLATRDVATVVGQLGRSGNAVGIGTAADVEPRHLAWVAPQKLLIACAFDLRQLDISTMAVSLVKAPVFGGVALVADPQFAPDTVFGFFFGADISAINTSGGIVQTQSTSARGGFDRVAVDTFGHGLVFASGAGTTIGYQSLNAIGWNGTSFTPSQTSPGEYESKLNIQVIAGSAAHPGGANGIGSSAQFFAPGEIALDEAGNLIALDSKNCTVRKIDRSSGATTTIVGSAGACSHIDGIGAAARLAGPTNLVSDGAGHAYIIDGPFFGRREIRRLDLESGELSTVYANHGSATMADTKPMDGPLVDARFRFLMGMAWDARARSLYLLDSNDEFGLLLRKLDLTTEQVTSSPFYEKDRWADGIAVGGDGELYLLLRRQGSSSSSITRVVFGSGASESIVDIDGGSGGLYPGADGRIYNADPASHVIRRFDPATRAITTMVGSPSRIGVQPGPVAASLNTPVGVAYDSDGQIFISDQAENVILVAK